MNLVKPRIRKVDKDQLKECAFKNLAGMHTEYELAERNRRLYLAMLMGNNFESKVKITFNTLDGYCEVNSVIWATTEKYVLLKGGSCIPLEAIVTVDMDTSQQNTNRIF